MAMGKQFFIPHNRWWVLAILALIWSFSLTLVVMGAVIALTAPIYPIDGTVGYDPKSRVELRVASFFFWCAIPIFWLLSSTYVLVQIGREKQLRLAILWVSISSIALLVIQFVLEYGCIRIWPSNPTELVNTYCPVRHGLLTLNQWDPYPASEAAASPWIMIPLLFLYLCLLACSLVELRCDRKTTVQEISPAPPNYSYFGNDAHLSAGEVDRHATCSSSLPRYSHGSMESIESLEKVHHDIEDVSAKSKRDNE